jgi:hypothetical protein
MSLLTQFAKSISLSLPITIIGIFEILVFKLTGEKDVLLGINQNLRDSPRLDQVIGFLINTVIFRNEIDDRSSLINFFKSMSLQFIKMLRHKIYPFEKALYEADIPLHRVGKIFLNIIDESHKTYNYADVEGCFLEKIEYPFFDLDFHLLICNNIIRIECIYKSLLFNKLNIRYLSEQFLRVIDIIVSNTTCLISEITL